MDVMNDDSLSARDHEQDNTCQGCIAREKEIEWLRAQVEKLRVNAISEQQDQMRRVEFERNQRFEAERRLREGGWQSMGGRWPL